MRYLEAQYIHKWHTDYIVITAIKGTQPVTFWLPSRSWRGPHAVEKQIDMFRVQATKQGIKLEEEDIARGLMACLVAIEKWGDKMKYKGDQRKRQERTKEKKNA